LSGRGILGVGLISRFFWWPMLMSSIIDWRRISFWISTLIWCWR
jgi:hypothetical protein